jgi:hypothetical protein
VRKFAGQNGTEKVFVNVEFQSGYIFNWYDNPLSLTLTDSHYVSTSNQVRQNW